ncbi:MAG: hypothetical protein ABIH65_03830 [Nanoarchaeota archaeon]
MKYIIPVIRLDNLSSLLPARAMNCDKIVVRAQDLLSKKKALSNYLFYRIKHCGGIHNFLRKFGYGGCIILSFIMKDELLEKINETILCDLIEGLKPDYYTTVDCESYDKDMPHSKRQIVEACRKTINLMRLCPEYKIIGHVKGCNERQIISHFHLLEKLGIKIFLLHSGDFLRHGDKNQIQKVKYYAGLIKKKDNIVLLYGFGSQKRFEEFSFVDGYITYSHIVNARKGIIFIGRKRQKYSGMKPIQAATHNLKQMFFNLKESQKQIKLFGGEKSWVEEYPELLIEKR